MPPLKTRVIWDPAPSDCIFKIKAAGDEHLFNVFASVSMNGQTRDQLRHDDIVRNGPAEVRVTAAGQRWVIKPTLFLSADPDDPITMEAWLENPDGTIVEIPIGGGKTQKAQCQWELDDDAFPLRVKISVTT